MDCVAARRLRPEPVALRDAEVRTPSYDDHRRLFRIGRQAGAPVATLASWTRTSIGRRGSTGTPPLPRNADVRDAVAVLSTDCHIALPRRLVPAPTRPPRPLQGRHRRRTLDPHRRQTHAHHRRALPRPRRRLLHPPEPRPPHQTPCPPTPSARTPGQPSHQKTSPKNSPHDPPLNPTAPTQPNAPARDPKRGRGPGFRYCIRRLVPTLTNETNGKR